MSIWTRGRRGFALALSVLTLGGLMAAPITAHADDPGSGKDGKKGGKKDDIPIVIGPSTIVHDPPKKKDK